MVVAFLPSRRSNFLFILHARTQIMASSASQSPVNYNFFFPLSVVITSRVARKQDCVASGYTMPRACLNKLGDGRHVYVYM